MAETMKISSDIILITSRSSAIKHDAEKVGDLKRAASCSATNVSAEKACQKVYSDGRDILKKYEKSAEKEADRLADIGRSFESLDKSMNSSFNRK